jgi:hypothetical protein
MTDYSSQEYRDQLKKRIEGAIKMMEDKNTELQAAIDGGESGFLRYYDIATVGIQKGFLGGLRWLYRMNKFE